MSFVQTPAGPCCPSCGCNATQQINGASSWSRWLCDACGKTFSAGRTDGSAGATYNPVNCRCPSCNAVNPKVETTKGRVRYHKCGCGNAFKSVEVVPTA